MAPHIAMSIERQDSVPLIARQLEDRPGAWRDHLSTQDFIIEAWSQGFLVGALLIMACITISNMRAGIFLHKLILLELFLAMFHGTFCFADFDGYAWYLSSTAALVYASWVVHNVVAWLKIKLFMTKKASLIFIGSLSLTVPPTVFQIVNNFLFFNNWQDLYERVRPYEPLFRDPWWLMSCILFLRVIKTRYKMSIRDLIYGHPRFAIMLLAMLFSILFTVVDIVASVAPKISIVSGINPYWKMALVFKALTDTIILDDFKTCLERLRHDLAYKRGNGHHNPLKPKPPPVPPKDTGHTRNKSSTNTFTTIRTSPTLVQPQSQSFQRSSSKMVIPRKPVGSQQATRPRSFRDALNRIGTALSPLPSARHHAHNPARLSSSFSPHLPHSQRSPQLGDETNQDDSKDQDEEINAQRINLQMDLGLHALADGEAFAAIEAGAAAGDGTTTTQGRTSRVNMIESPLDPTWPLFPSVRRGQTRSMLSNCNASNSNASSKRTSRSIGATSRPVSGFGSRAVAHGESFAPTAAVVDDLISPPDSALTWGGKSPSPARAV